jgi:hypothetical protein
MTDADLAKASAGIRAPKVTTLQAGESVFRFASTKNMKTGASIPSDQWALGSWWLPEASYRQIIQNYQSGKLSLGTVGRAAAAVQPSWSNMDVSIKARVVEDIDVYIGKGKTQYRDELPNGMFVTLEGWPDIDQIYIPSDCRGAALFVVRNKIITTDDFGW